MLSRLGRVRAVVVVAVTFAAIAFPLAALALTFSDVPPSHPFYGQITAISGAGITNGFPDGTYRPNDPVTRGQMAAFMHRGFAATTAGAGSLTFEDAQTAYVAEASLTSPGVAGGTGYVVVDADVSAFTQEAGVCPCEVEIWVDLYQGASLVDASTSMFFDVSDAATPTGFSNGAGSVSWVFAVPTGTALTFAVGANISATGTAADPLTAVTSTMTATYVPFGNDSGLAASEADQAKARSGSDHSRSLTE